LATARGILRLWKERCSARASQNAQEMKEKEATPVESACSAFVQIER
jgi:hypothetical protein